MNHSPTVFSGIDNFQTGGVQAIDANPKAYAFSNVFHVAARAAPYERVAVGRNLKYVLEAVRAEGSSPWFTAAHDEAALVMDGEVLIHFVQPEAPLAPADSEGARALAGPPAGRRMGSIRARRGHMALLPAGSAYQFQATRGIGALLIQTIAGPQTVERWAEICQTA